MMMNLGIIKIWLAIMAICFGLLVAVTANAQQAVSFSTQTGTGYGRILVSWPEGNTPPGLHVEANITNSVLVIKFNELFTGDSKLIRDGLPNQIALARLDGDGKTIRIALRQPVEVQTSKSHNVFAIDLVAPNAGITPPKLVSPLAKRQADQIASAKKRVRDEVEKAKHLSRESPALPLQVRHAQSLDNTRITFDWTETVEFRMLERQNGLDIVFDRPAVPALAALNAAQPRGFLSASSQVRQGKTIVSINKSFGFSHRISREGTYVNVDLFGEVEPSELVVSALEPTPDSVAPSVADPIASVIAPVKSERDNPVPLLGVVPVKVTAKGSALHLTFDWAAPVGAASFQRGDALWIVFDATVRMDILELREGGSRHVVQRKALQGLDYSGLKIRIPASTQIEARPNGDGTSWTFILDDTLAFPIAEIDLRREADGSGPGRLAALVKNATSLLWVEDEDVGDTLVVVTGVGPSVGLTDPRRFVEVSVLPSAQGMAFEIAADGLDIQLTGELLTINSTKGLNLTPSATPLHLNSQRTGEIARMGAAPAISASPGFIDFEKWKNLGGEGSFHKTYGALLRRVAIEDTNPEARMILARFLIAHELGAEALGALSLAQALDPLLVQDARFRALRGTANLQMHRIKNATADFAAQTLNRDPSAALWRGYLAVQTENWIEARHNFEKGHEAFYLFIPEWQAKFHIAFAQAAMQLNDLGAAKAQLREVFGNNLSLPTQLEASMARAELAHRSGQSNQALSILRNVIATKYEPLVVQAIFAETRMKQDLNQISQLEVSEVLENLRFRWRGDKVELESARILGAFYSETGDYRRAMEAMSLAVRRFPDSPVAKRLQVDLSRTFLELFLEGGADSMDPIQAVALFYEFQSFVPLGNDGDRMLRRMADRLIVFDLLPQAAELLQYQVDQKLFGLGKAQVAADLALVYLMDHQPEKALRAINSSRQARLPRALNMERRLLEARALLDLGRTQHALDLIEVDRTKDAEFLRADIFWLQKDWPKITKQLTQTIERHVYNPAQLAENEASLILRATIASALADDKPAFDALVSRWADVMAETDAAEAFRLISAQTNLGGVEVKDLARSIGGTDTMRSYLEQYRNRLAERTQSAAVGATLTGDGPTSNDG